MNALLRVVLGGAILLMLFFAFNSYIYDQKQSDVVPREDGEHFGFVRSLVDNDTAIDFDHAVWLTGDAGIAAAIEAGLCTEDAKDECLPNDYFIDNKVVASERVPVSSDLEVEMQTWKMEETGVVEARIIPFSEFSALINDKKSHWNTLPYRITITDGQVSRIVEVYVP